ncbi:hypothetical protein RHSIM_Rhsim09G0198100 [Rhododendron simsii]|uniref:DNA-directed RNA polymerase III subunit RPC3 n=1 Tax=Rhododendron simsii TaxID=118357 RepID=A0A834LE25_RHOSS|nr:hypothetical protein RHSIM_Rhsim09G0198100 [Rhododendron simsii]
MVSQHGIKLAVYLISSYFGDLVAKVCECLLRRGTLPLGSIVLYTELNKLQVTNCLLVLIQHNCVQAFAIEQQGGFGSAPKVVTQYMALFDNIIHHMRFPKFLEIVSQEFGKECLEILEGLLMHALKALQYGEWGSLSNGNCSAKDAVKISFNRLVHARYVERCPAHEPFLAPPEEETGVKKKGSKSAKVTEELTMEQRALAAAAPMEALRFLVETYAETDDNEQEIEEKLPSVAVGEKRKQIDSQLDTEAGTNKRKKEILWRANFEEFVRCLRNKACIANVRTRFDDGAAIVLNAILEATKRSDTKAKVEKSVPLSVNSIFEEVMKSEDGRTMTLEHVRVALIELGCHLPSISLDETYSIGNLLLFFSPQLILLENINLKHIIELAQNEEVESIVLKRYGREAYRMFRLLSKAGHLLETDKIADTTFVEKKNTAKILFKLWKDDYLHLEKIVATGSRQTQFFLWKVNKQSLWGHALDEMYHAALNLRIRNAVEQEQGKEGMFLVEIFLKNP